MKKSSESAAEPSFLGVECGATHSNAILADAHQRLIKELTLGPANIRLLTDRGLNQFFKQLQRHFPTPSSIAIGMAGARIEMDRDRIRSAAHRQWKDIPCHATNDLETALMAASLNPAARPPSSPSPAATILLLSGTGSCCLGRHQDGTQARMGGWGHVLGDKGSGYEIGLRGLKAVLYYYDRDGKWSALGKRLLRALQLNEPEDLIDWSLQSGKSETAALAIEVFQAASKRDPIATDILKGAAYSLAKDACACARRLVKPGTAVRVVLSGSILLRQKSFTRQVTRQIQSIWPEASIQPLKYSGTWGAVLLARQSMDTPAPPEPPLKSLKGNQVTGQAPFVTAPDPEISLSPTEQRHPKSMRLDTMPILKAVDLMLEEESVIQRALKKERLLIEKAVRQIARSFRRKGRLFYAGAGTSGRLGVLDASECPPTFQSDPDQVQGIIAGGASALWKSVEGAEDDPSAGARAVEFRGINSPDVLVGIAASGRTPFVWGALNEAKKRGAYTILVSFNPYGKIPAPDRPNLIIRPAIGPEILTGSTRLKAGTATKLLLNMFTTLAMVQLGKTISNLMVDVKASNVKLKDRAARIVAELTDADYPQSRQALMKTKWDIKKACHHLNRKMKPKKS